MKNTSRNESVIGIALLISPEAAGLRYRYLLYKGVRQAIQNASV